MDTNLTSRNAPDAEARQGTEGFEARREEARQEREKLERRQEEEKREDLQRMGVIAQELAELKDIMREVSSRVRRVERRVESVLAPPATAFRARMQQLRTLEETHRLIDHLIERAGADEQIEDELGNYSVKGGLAEVARELGLANTRLPPRDDLIPIIATRLREIAHVRRPFGKY